MRTSWTGTSQRFTPGSFASRTRSRATISPADTPRSFSGFSETNIVPELREPPPVTAVRVSTAGSERTISTSRVIFCCIAWNELDWSARIQPIRRPVSCCGKKPFGISMYR